MSQKNEILPLLLTVMVTSALLGGIVVTLDDLYSFVGSAYNDMFKR